ncbi:hypothetical protein PM082_008808 [Marasmius tenuissimus]|nr:hypothetical protein PM082_008808 [Marasmius tenuissimus]
MKVGITQRSSRRRAVMEDTVGDSNNLDGSVDHPSRQSGVSLALVFPGSSLLLHASFFGSRIPGPPSRTAIANINRHFLLAPVFTSVLNINILDTKVRLVPHRIQLTRALLVSCDPTPRHLPTPPIPPELKCILEVATSNLRRRKPEAPSAMVKITRGWEAHRTAQMIDEKGRASASPRLWIYLTCTMVTGKKAYLVETGHCLSNLLIGLGKILPATISRLRI